MPKKKTVNKNNPEGLKEAGNKAFAAGNFQEAIKQFTMAIEITLEQPNHVYFANRANCHLELNEFEECISDCNQAIQIYPSYSKSYFRKAKALVNLQRLKEALEVAEEGLKLEPDNPAFLELISEIQKEIEQDNVLPLDHPERRRFNALLDWMERGGADFSKLKLRYYSENYRGVHASQNIKSGEVILYVPLNQIITLEMAYQTPIGRKMYEKNLRSKLISPKHTFLGSYILQEKKKDEQRFAEYLDILPKGLNDFPIFFTEDELEFLKGSPFLDQVHEKIEDIKQDYDFICKEVPEFS
jgi:histone-lysine N-methyltransferase SETD3